MFNAPCLSPLGGPMEGIRRVIQADEVSTEASVEQQQEGFRVLTAEELTLVGGAGGAFSAAHAAN
jgi:hypothetical protein